MTFLPIRHSGCTTFQLALPAAPLGSRSPILPLIAACSLVLCANFKGLSFQVLKTWSAGAVGFLHHQSCSVKFLASLASPSVGCHHALHILDPTAVVHPVARPCHCRAPLHSSRARGRLGLSHLRSFLCVFQFRGESLVLVRSSLCPGSADVQRNGIAVLAGCPPSWSELAAMSRRVCLRPTICVRT